MRGRRRFLSGLGALAVCIASPARAQQRAARIGYLVQSPLIDPPSAERAAFLNELQRLGWTVGRNLLIEYRSAENEPDFLKDLAEDLIRMNVDLIVTAGGTSANDVKAMTSRIPIVFTQHPDPVGAGLVRSLAKPGGNVTGLSFVSPDLAEKRLQLLRELVPSARRIGLIWASYADELQQREVKVIVAFANRLGLAVETQSIESADALARWLDRAGRNRLDAVLVLADLKMVSYRDVLVEHALRLRLPLVTGWPDAARAGALASYSASFTELFRRSAHYVDRILRGAKPGDLPVEQPTRFEMVVNLRSARALGITVPRAVLARADEVIE